METIKQGVSQAAEAAQPGLSDESKASAISSEVRTLSEWEFCFVGGGDGAPSWP